MPDFEPHDEPVAAVFAQCAKVVDKDAWLHLLSENTTSPSLEAFPDCLDAHAASLNLPVWIADLARIEWARHQAMTTESPSPDRAGALGINPTLQLIPCSWSGLADLFSYKTEPDTAMVRRGQTTIGIWKVGAHLVTEALPDEDLLVLKLVLENIPREEVATLGQVPVGAIDHAVNRAVRRGLLVTPHHGIRRTDDFPRGRDVPEEFFHTTAFSLQWHLTQACDLHCRHCYDRTDRLAIPFAKACSVLGELRAFCTERYLDGHISFTGGNPLLYPEFNELYKKAADYGFSVGILGNPTSKSRVEELIAIARPRFYQVSLEGLREHNDHIRGAGHFDRVMEFLELLRELGISSMVMLTLTRANLEEVIPLAELLEARTDLFTFNRLSLVGEGANLALPETKDFERILRDYHPRAHPGSPVALKDNLFNVIRFEQGGPFFGGCAGHGCSAAFNFVSLLPDGEVHACRKFPSLIGNINEQTISEIYDCEEARRYRRGTLACDDCSIRPVCGGCLAVTSSLGLNIYKDRDPFCFINPDAV